MKLRLILLSLICLTGVWACRKNNKSPLPSINFISFAPDSVHGGSYKDTAFLSFGFRDGDGDLGNDPATGQYDVFLKDNRDATFPIMRYFFPPIPDDARDPIDGLEGKGVIAIRAIYIVPRQDTLHKLHSDTVKYKMWIVDRAGNISDTIETTPLII